MSKFHFEKLADPEAIAARRKRVVLIAALLCALLSLGCGTWSLTTEIARTDEGKHQASLHMGIEIDKGVWRALQDMEGGADSGSMMSDLQQQGWAVTKLEDGRVVTATKELIPLENLAQQGWTVIEEKREQGRVVTATLDTTKLGTDSSTDSAVKSHVIVIDETDPDTPVYTFLSTVVIPPYEPPSDDPQSTCNPNENSLGGFFCAMAEAAKNDPKQKALMQAVKNAGPPKILIGITLPGVIEQATVNGSPSGEISGENRERVRWVLPADRPGTYNLRAVGTAGATLKLDRKTAARFGAIRISGRGFKPKTHVNIMLNGTQIFRVEETLPNGKIPDDIWIWVPDDAPFGENKVWAEEGATDVKSNKVTVTVNEITLPQLVENLDAVLQPYMDDPRLVNQQWHGKLNSGGFRNIANAGGTVSAGALWLVTTVFTLGYYQADLWPDNTYVCSWYQAEVLNYLNRLRFHPDPAQRALLDGLDFGPFNSGLVDIAPGSHFFVVLWPHAAALNPSVAASIAPTWSTAGIVLDPWPRQAPGVFELKSGTAAWAETSIYSARWKIGSQYSYWQPRPEPTNFGYHKGDYPVIGGEYYNPKGVGKLATDYRGVVGIGGEPPKSLSVKSPVALEFRDAQGRRAGMRPDGQLFDEIPNSEILVVPKPEGGYEWYVALPEGQLDVTITGTDAGSFQLLTKNAGQAIQEYPKVPVTKSGSFTIVLDDQASTKPLQPEQGSAIYPANNQGALTGLPGVLAGVRLNNRLLIWVGVGVAICLGLLVVFVGARRSRARRMAALSASRADQPGREFASQRSRSVDLPEQDMPITPAIAPSPKADSLPAQGYPVPHLPPPERPEGLPCGAAGTSAEPVVVCPRCGTKRGAGARFCGTCGQSLSG